MAVELGFEVRVDAQQAQAELRSTEQGFQATTKSAQDLGTVSTKTQDELALLAGELAVCRLEAKNLTAAEKDAIDASLKLGNSIKDTADKTGIATGTIRQYQESLKNTSEQTGGWQSKIAALATGGAILGAIKATAEWADRLGELSAQTGFGIVALQKFDAAAKLNGASLEKVASAQGFFQNAIETGSKKVSDAVVRLGLDLNTIKTMSPDEQMRTLAEAITNVKDPTERATIATELFGKAGRSLIPTLEEIANNYDKLPAASEEAIKNTGNLADMVVRLKDSVLRFLAEAASPFVTVLSGIGSVMDAIGASSGWKAISQFLPKASEFLPWTRLITDVQLVMGKLDEPTVKAAAGFDKLMTSAKAAANDGLPEVVRLAQKGGDVMAFAAIAEQEVTKQIKDHNAEVKAQAKVHGDLVGALEQAQHAMGNLTAQQIASIEAGLKLHANVEDIAKSTHTTVDVVKLYEAGLKDAATAQHAYNQEVKQTEQFQKAMDMSVKSSTEIVKAFNEKVQKAAEEGAKKMDASVKAMNDERVKANADADATIRSMTMSSLDFQIDSIRREGEARKAMFTDGSELARQTRDAIDRDTAASIAKLQQENNQVRAVILDIGRTANENFAAMLSGAESFGEGFTNIWHSIENGVTTILGNIIQYFEKVFIARITASLVSGGGIWGSLISAAIGNGFAAGAAQAAESTATRAGVGLITNAAYGTGAQSGANVLLRAATPIGVPGVTAASHAGLSTLAPYAGPAAGALVGGVVGWQVGRATGNWAAGAAAGAGSGAATGALVGSYFGGVGAVPGAIVGGAVGAIAGAWGAHEANEDARNQMVAIRSELEKTFGSLDNVRKNAQMVGVDIDKAFANIGRGVKGTKEFNAVVDEFETKWNALDGAMKRYGLTVDDIKNANKSAADNVNDFAKQIQSDYTALTAAGLSPDQTLTKMAGGFNDLLAQAQDTGTKLPATMIPFLQKLNEMGLLTDANKAKLLGLSDSSTVDIQGMTDIANKYGVSLEALGPKFQQAKISDTARQIFADFTTLTDAGADAGGVLAGMSDEISGLVNDSIKFGTTIPENMRPLIQVLMDSGQLLDENGKAITDMGKIQFGASLEDQFQKLTDAINKLGDTLSGELPKQFGEGLDKISQTASSHKIMMDVGFTYDALQPPDSGASGAAQGGIVTGAGVQYLARGGRVLGFVPRGTDTVPAMLTPGEGVLSRRGMQALGELNRGESGGEIKVTIDLRGAVISNDSALNDLTEEIADRITQRIKGRRKFGRRAA